ncbi:MAG: glycolate oxidase subunit GlcF, partial [Gammaproteobacteria bacterium]|nr:glycolate oxidase subunit GlcF [Gammaproteobacteria bacterium]
LRETRQKALSVDAPELIATANIGCQLHLAQGGNVTVVHWIELI